MFWISFISVSQMQTKKRRKNADGMPSEVPCEMEQKGETRYWKIMHLAHNASTNQMSCSIRHLVLCFRLFGFCGKHGNSVYGFAFSKPCETRKIGRGNKPIWNKMMDLRLHLSAGYYWLAILKDVKDLALAQSKSCFLPSWIHKVLRLFKTKNANGGFFCRSDPGLDSCRSKFVRELE